MNRRHLADALKSTRTAYHLLKIAADSESESIGELTERNNVRIKQASAHLCDAIASCDFTKEDHAQET